MIKVLKFISIFFWIITIVLWIGDFWKGIPYSIVDLASEQGLTNLEIDKLIIKNRLYSLLKVPFIMVPIYFFSFSILKNKDYKYDLIGILYTLVFILVFIFFGVFKESSMPYKNIAIVLIGLPCIVFIINIYDRLKE